jgi:hypothetical protein
MYGPLEYVLFQFEDDRFLEELLPALVALNDQGCVRFVDLVFITKDESGNLTIVEIDELTDEDAAAFEPLVNDEFGALTEEDVVMAAENLPGNTFAAVVLFEHIWALGLQQAVQNSGGFLLDSAYVHPETQSEVIFEIQQNETNGGKR